MEPGAASTGAASVKMRARPRIVVPKSLVIGPLWIGKRV